jgi:hypothetical protein
MAFVVLSSGAEAAPAPSKRSPRQQEEGLKLVLWLDRKEYLEREPVLAEWGLVNNSRRTLRVAGQPHWRGLRFEWRQGDGEWLPLRSRLWRCGTGIPAHEDLPAREGVWAWIDLRGGYAGLPTTGKFAVRAVVEAKVFLTENDTIGFTLASDEVHVESKRARNEDAKAVKIIQDRIPLPYVPLPTGRVDEDADAADRYVRAIACCDDWGSSKEISQELLNKTYSARFHVAARFSCGRTAIRNEAAASALMKGLAALERAWTELYEGGKQDAIRQALKLIETHPDGVVAYEARKIARRTSAKE